MSGEQDKVKQSWWRQFTISNLLLLTALTAVVFAWRKDRSDLLNRLRDVEAVSDSLRGELRDGTRQLRAETKRRVDAEQELSDLLWFFGTEEGRPVNAAILKAEEAEKNARQVRRRYEENLDWVRWQLERHGVKPMSDWSARPPNGPQIYKEFQQKKREYQAEREREQRKAELP